MIMKNIHRRISIVLFNILLFGLVGIMIKSGRNIYKIDLVFDSPILLVGDEKRQFTNDFAMAENIKFIPLNDYVIETKLNELNENLTVIKKLPVCFRSLKNIQINPLISEADYEKNKTFDVSIFVYNNADVPCIVHYLVNYINSDSIISAKFSSERDRLYKLRDILISTLAESRKYLSELNQTGKDKIIYSNIAGQLCQYEQRISTINYFINNLHGIELSYQPSVEVRPIGLSNTVLFSLLFGMALFFSFALIIIIERVKNENTRYNPQ